MSALKEYVNRINLFRGWNSQPAINASKLTQADVDFIAEQLDCDMSPENLACDGEISVREINRKAKFYNEVAFELCNTARVNGMTQPKFYEIG